jgi:RimJ/RimL family protein N-acetyltransferase
MSSSHSENFCFPVHALSNTLITLTPFNPSKHTSPFYEGTKHHPSFFAYLFFGPFSSLAACQSFTEEACVSSKSQTVFAILSKASPNDMTGQLAGICSYDHASPSNASVEVGVIILPTFQRTHITSNALGLLLIYALDVVERGGLGLRRVQYQTHALNEASRRLAVRMGLNYEGVKRCDRTVPWGKVGNGVEVGEGRYVGEERGEDGEQSGKEAQGKGLGPSRDTAVYAICWDEWEGKRGLVERQMVKR